MVVSEVVIVVREPYSKIGGTHYLSIFITVDLLGSHFCFSKSLTTVVPGVAGRKNVLQVLFSECDL